MSVEARKQIADLYQAIMDTAKGEQVASVGHKGRTAAYNGAQLKDQIKLYRMIWFKGCGSPELTADLDASLATRGCFNIRMLG